MNQTASIIRGSDRSITLAALQTPNQPLDISTASEIEVRFPGVPDSSNTPTIVSKKLSLGGVTITSGPAGLFQVALTHTDTPLLVAGAGLSFAVLITIASAVSIINFQKMLNVADPTVG